MKKVMILAMALLLSACAMAEKPQNACTRKPVQSNPQGE